MRLTNHAKERFQQRGFSNFSLDIIQQYGRYEKAPGGAIKVFFGNKEANRLRQKLKKIIQSIDKINGGAMIIEDNCIVTFYKQKH